MLIEAAETGGSLPDSFKMLSHWHEFVERITRQIQLGRRYPLFLSMRRRDRPLPTLISSFIGGQADVGGYLRRVLGILLLLYVPVLVILGSMLFKERARPLCLVLDHVVLRVPGLGCYPYHLSVYRYAKAFGMLYKAGVPVSECAERAALATGNAAVTRLFAGGAANVRKGGMMWEGFSRRLPAEYLHLWQIGEETASSTRPSIGLPRRPRIGRTATSPCCAMAAEGGLLRRLAHRGLHGTATGHASIRRFRYPVLRTRGG